MIDYILSIDWMLAAWGAMELVMLAFLIFSIVMIIRERIGMFYLIATFALLVVSSVLIIITFPNIITYVPRETHIITVTE